MKKKERLDKILVDNGYFDTKSRAQAAVMAGDVKINDEVITKAGFQFELKENTRIEIKSLPYVSRGGLKLKKALETFNIDLTDKICIDAGASTGGFTDCMLQNGAKMVYAVDVGYGQLAWKLRNNSKVKVIERLNIRHAAVKEIYGNDIVRVSFCSIDLSFISITKVLENVISLMDKDTVEIVALIKPQFEAGKEQVGKNGVVKDRSTHIEVIENIISYANSLDLNICGLTYSPIKGPAGNIEYLIYISNVEYKKTTFSVEEVVYDAFNNLVQKI